MARRQSTFAAFMQAASHLPCPACLETSGGGDAGVALVLAKDSNNVDLSSTQAYKLTDVLPLVDETSVHLRKSPTTAEYRLFRLWSNQLAMCYGTTEAPQGLARTSPAHLEGTHGGRFSFFADTLQFKGGGKGNAAGGAGPNGASNSSSSGKSSSGGGGGAASTPSLATPIMPLVGFVHRYDCFSPNYGQDSSIRRTATSVANREPEHDHSSVR